MQNEHEGSGLIYEEKSDFSAEMGILDDIWSELRHVQPSTMRPSGRNVRRMLETKLRLSHYSGVDASLYSHHLTVSSAFLDFVFRGECAVTWRVS